MAAFRAEQFRVRVDDEVLADLRARIMNMRWPGAAPGAPWEQGTDLGYLRGLLGYWAGGFDWRAQERWLNGFGHFRAGIDGVRVHFVHERARGGRGIPLILTNGWPSCFAEFLAWFGTDEDCLDYLEWMRWPGGFAYPRCGHAGGWRLADAGSSAVAAAGGPR